MKIFIGDTVYDFPCGGDVNLLESDEKEMLNEYEKATKIIDKINSDLYFESSLVFWYRTKEITYTAEEIRTLGASYDPEEEDSLLP